MKKFFIVIIVFLIILGGVKTEADFTLLSYFSGEYTAYTEASTDNGINLGFCYMNSKPNSSSVVGESLVVENLEVGSALSELKAAVVKTEFLNDGTTVVYAYSPLINRRVEAFNHNVNLQIAIKEDVTIIGWPLILGSF